MNHFWSFATSEEDGSELRLDGEIAAETWWGDEVTPAEFRAELSQRPGDITVWINSPGGDVFAASSIYTALKEHPGRVTIKIEALAASAASVIAMAGDEVLISPTAYMMIHNPWTVAMGDSAEMRSVAKMLDEVAEGIMSAYEIKTGQPREKLKRLMQSETWMSAESAVELGFADGMLYTQESSAGEPARASAAAQTNVPAKRAAARQNMACVFAASTHADMLIHRMLDTLHEAPGMESNSSVPAPAGTTNDDEARKRLALRMKLKAHATL